MTVLDNIYSVVKIPAKKIHLTAETMPKGRNILQSVTPEHYATFEWSCKIIEGEINIPVRRLWWADPVEEKTDCGLSVQLQTNDTLRLGRTNKPKDLYRMAILGWVFQGAVKREAKSRMTELEVL